MHSHRRHYLTALALERTAHADAQFPRLRDAIHRVMMAALYYAARNVHATGTLKITRDMRASWSAAILTALRRPILYMGAHGYNLAGRETGVARAALATAKSAPHSRYRGKASEGGVELPDKENFVVDTDWRGLDKWVSTTAESASSTLGKRMLSIFEDAAAYRDPETGRGKTPVDIAKQLMALGTDMTAERAEMLARTGAIFAYNEGAMERYADDGVAVMQWLTADDDLTCPYCAELNAKMVSPKDSFYDASDTLSVDGGTLKFKFAVKHPPAHPRCRCTVIPMVDEKQFDDR